MIDLHAHPLPGIDDGPPGIEQAIAMARAAAAAGTRKMAATPHIDYRWEINPAEVPGRVRELNQRLAAEGIQLEVVQGGEIAASRLADLQPPERDAVRLGGGPYLLVECPHVTVGSAFGMIIFEALTHGEQVMLAHPERSPEFADDLEGMERLVGAGALCSITAGSLSGRFGSAARRGAIDLLAAGLVHNVASDAHDAENRPPVLLAGMQAADQDLPGIVDQAAWYTEDAPAAILAGEPLPERPDPPARRKRRWRDSLRRA